MTNPAMPISNAIVLASFRVCPRLQYGHSLNHLHARLPFHDLADLPVRLLQFLAARGEEIHFVGRDGRQDAAVGLRVKSAAANVTKFSK